MRNFDFAKNVLVWYLCIIIIYQHPGKSLFIFNHDGNVINQRPTDTFIFFHDVDYGEQPINLVNDSVITQVLKTM